MRRFLLPLLTALALPTSVNADLIVSKKEYLASLPVAAFTDPTSIQIPEGFPSNTVYPQVFKRAYWLQDGIKNSENFRIAFYEGGSRRSGNIVSILTMSRKLFKNTPEKSSFHPTYNFTVLRYDCANDRSQREDIAQTTSALDGREGFRWASNSQTKVFIEGYPNWVARSDYLTEWTQVRMGSYGAGNLDYACSNY